VADLPTARDFLVASGFLGASSETELVIAPSKIRGLNIRLVSEPTAPPLNQ
jgi:hypothetical protein